MSAVVVSLVNQNESLRRKAARHGKAADGPINWKKGASLVSKGLGEVSFYTGTAAMLVPIPQVKAGLATISLFSGVGAFMFDYENVDNGIGAVLGIAGKVTEHTPLRYYYTVNKATDKIVPIITNTVGDGFDAANSGYGMWSRIRSANQ